MKLNNSRITWEPDSDIIFINKLQQYEPVKSQNCSFSSGAVYSWIQNLRPDSEEAISAVAILALRCIFLDRVKPITVLREFLKIDEFKNILCAGESKETPEEILAMLHSKNEQSNPTKLNKD